MNIVVHDFNSKEMIKERVALGQLTWKGPMLVVFSRLAFAVLAQSLVFFLFFRVSGSYQETGVWWPVYGTLIDVGCFVLIYRLVKKEDIRFGALLNINPQKLGGDVLAGLGYVLWVFPLAMGGIIGCSMLVYGSPEPPSIYGLLPVGAAVYALVIFPAIWGLIEQVTYQGYVLPRLEVIFSSRAASITVVVFGWAVQHIALPLMLDWHYMLYRFLSFVPLALVMTLVYLRRRRLLPFIIAHWIVDLLGVLSGVILPMIAA